MRFFFAFAMFVLSAMWPSSALAQDVQINGKTYRSHVIAKGDCVSQITYDAVKGRVRDAANFWRTENVLVYRDTQDLGKDEQVMANVQPLDVVFISVEVLGDSQELVPALVSAPVTPAPKEEKVTSEPLPAQTLNLTSEENRLLANEDEKKEAILKQEENIVNIEQAANVNLLRVNRMELTFVGAVFLVIAMVLRWRMKIPLRQDPKEAIARTSKLLIPHVRRSARAIDVVPDNSPDHPKIQELSLSLEPPPRPAPRIKAS